MSIGGNITASIQSRETNKNELGEDVVFYKTTKKIKGWLDYSSGQTKYETYKAPVEDSTHVFITDYKKQLKADRLLINGKNYDVLLIDDPMELHKHIEIFLRYIG